MFIEGGKKSPLGFLWEVAFPLTLNNFGGVVERGVGRSQGGPMTGLLCGPGGWGRGGILTSRKVLPVPGNTGQVLTPAFLSTLPSAGPRLPAQQPGSPSSVSGLGESPGPAHRKRSPHPEPGGNLLSLGNGDKMFTIRTHCYARRHLRAGLRKRLREATRPAQGGLWTRASLVALARLTGSLSGFMSTFPSPRLCQCFSIS